LRWLPETQQNKHVFRCDVNFVQFADCLQL
jgi:hypothetical protein